MGSIFYDPWETTYGTAYQVDESETPDGDVAIVEGDGRLEFHDGAGSLSGSVAFVDGVRRGEGVLQYVDDDGAEISGIVGAYGCGAVLVEPGQRPTFHQCAATRLALWGDNRDVRLPDVSGGWAWESQGTKATNATELLGELQNRMRNAEARLADELCGAGHLTIVDGPLEPNRKHDRPIIGYVKTHHRRLLPLDLHGCVPQLGEGQRTSMFALRADVHSCYVRLAARQPREAPWAGIVRLDLPTAPGPSVVIEQATRAAATLPRYAGVAHVDPRAPQNLQPIGALEQHLRHLLGEQSLASRAVRSAVGQLAPLPVAVPA